MNDEKEIDLNSNKSDSDKYSKDFSFITEEEGDFLSQEE